MNIQEIIAASEKMNEVASKLKHLDNTIIQIDEIAEKLATLKKQINNVFNNQTSVTTAAVYNGKKAKNMWPQQRPLNTFKVIEVTGKIGNISQAPRVYSPEHAEAALMHRKTLSSGMIWISEAEQLGSSVFTYRRKMTYNEMCLVTQYKNINFR